MRRRERAGVVVVCKVFTWQQLEGEGGMDGGGQGVEGGVEDHSAGTGGGGIRGDAGREEFGIVTGSLGGFEGSSGILRELGVEGRQTAGEEDGLWVKKTDGDVQGLTEGLAEGVDVGDGAAGLGLEEGHAEVVEIHFGGEGEVGDVSGEVGGAAEDLSAEDEAEIDVVVEVEAEEVFDIAGGTKPAFGQGDAVGGAFDVDGESGSGGEEGADREVFPVGQAWGAAEQAVGVVDDAGEGDADAEAGAAGEVGRGGELFEGVSGAGEGLGGGSVGRKGDVFSGEGFAGEIEGEEAEVGGLEVEAPEAVGEAVEGEPDGFAAGLGGGGAFFTDEATGDKVAGGIGDGAPGESGKLLEVRAGDGPALLDGAQDGEDGGDGHGVAPGGDTGARVKHRGSEVQA